MKFIRVLLVLLFVFVMALGWKYTIVGLMVFPMIAGGMVLAFYNGRWFCGNICPRGLFFHHYVDKIAPKNKIPKVFMHPIFRWTFFAIFMGKMSYSMLGIYQNGFKLEAVASAFWWSMLGSTVIAFVGGFIFNSRFWCSVCPVGTFANAVKGVKPVKYTVDDSCKECGLCAAACKFGHNPADYKGGELDNSDCIKCGDCIDACKSGAIKK